ncbi:hypothetical protein Tco_0529831 [Tanacetum coccineum]
MSKRSLATVTCSLAQNDLVDFVEKYGIPWCYNPKLPESHQTALDTLKGYIPLYLSLFTIVARVTTFSVVCKAYGGEASVPLFRAFLTVGPAGDWLTFQKRPGSSIPTLFGNSMSNIPSWKSKFIFVKETLISDLRPGLITDFCHGQGSFSYPYPTKPFDEALWNHLRRHTLEAETFLEPILYLAEMAFYNFMKKPSESPFFSVRDQDECSSLLKEKGVSGFELAVVGEGIPGQNASFVREGSKRRRSITESPEEEATVVKIMPKKNKLESPRQMSARGSIPPPPSIVPKDVEEAHAAHNMISGLHCPLLKDKLGFLSFDELVDVFDVHTLQTTVDRLAKAQRNQDMEGSQVMKDLRSENARILEEVSMLRSVVASAEEPQKELSKELSGLRPFLYSKLEAVSLEKAKFVKDFIPFVVKKLFESEHFNQALRDL